MVPRHADYDLRDRDDIVRLYKETRPHVVLHLAADPRYLRPTEVDLLIGNASKAKQALGWEPKVTFNELVRLMVDADVSTVNHAGREVFGDTNSRESATSGRS